MNYYIITFTDGGFTGVNAYNALQAIGQLPSEMQDKILSLTLKP